jgi:hypothetical protein
MRAFKREGVAIVFVSHNMQAVSELCDHAMQLDGGVVRIGDARDVIAGFISDLSAVGGTADGPAISISATPLATDDGVPVEAVGPGARLRQVVSLAPRETLNDVGIALSVLRSTDGLRVYDGFFTPTDLGFASLQAGRIYRFDVGFTANLLRGQYHLEWWVVHSVTHECLALLTPAAVFRVDEYRSTSGVVDLDARLEPGTVDA